MFMFYILELKENCLALIKSSINCIKVSNAFIKKARPSQPVEHETLHLKVVGSSSTSGEHFMILLGSILLAGTS